MESNLHEAVIELYKNKIKSNEYLVLMCFFIIIMFLIISSINGKYNFIINILVLGSLLIFNLFYYSKKIYLNKKIQGELFKLEGKALEVNEKKNKIIVKVLLEKETIDFIKSNNIEMFISKDNKIELNLSNLAHIKFIDTEVLKEEKEVCFVYSSKGNYVLDFNFE